MNIDNFIKNIDINNDKYEIEGKTSAKRESLSWSDHMYHTF